MIGFLIARLLGIIGIIAAMTFVVFVLQQVVPGDPARAFAGPNAPAEVVQAKRTELGLDRPLHVQYLRYLGRLAHGDLGRSIRTNHSIASDITTFLPASLELIAAALVLGLFLGFGVALSSYVAGGGSSLLRFILIASSSAPVFLVAIGLLLVFWFGLAWLPGNGRISRALAFTGPTGFLILDAILTGRFSVLADVIRHLLLPALTLSLPVSVAVARTLSSSLTTVMRSNYIRTARSKGLSAVDVVLRHGLRNAIQSPLQMMALQLGMLFANILIVERIFGWPGLGLYMVQAFAASDLPVIMGVAVAFALIYTAANIVVDLLQALADPRLRRVS
jgi:peptide/nickel transport system permease protein/dipeptide transport system permease protein